MTETALSALIMAWTTTLIATTLFVTVLALSEAWDSASYRDGLQTVLVGDG